MKVKRILFIFIVCLLFVCSVSCKNDEKQDFDVVIDGIEYCFYGYSGEPY